VKEHLKLTAVAFLVLLLVPAFVFGGTTGKISGVVRDTDTGETIPGVSIIVEGTTLGAVSDVDGYYYILNIPPGKYSVTATMIGYVKSTTEDVVVNADRTTEVNFSLKPTVIEVAKALVVTAKRSLVEPDLAASQAIVTPEETETLPANEILHAMTYEPGVSLSGGVDLRIRGDTPDEVSFQVDGLERTDPLNNKAYTILNSAMIQEIQILTGGFNAEYGNLRAGFVNVLQKEGARNWTYSADFRYVPAHKKHFGPGAYDSDQYDYLLFDTKERRNGDGKFFDKDGNETFTSYEEVWSKPLQYRLPNEKPLWIGWNARAEQLNKSNWMGKNNWTADDLMEVWEWRHPKYKYGEDPDVYLDSGFGGPLPLDPIGLKNASFFAGYKFNRVYLAFPAIVPAAVDQSFELKFTAYPKSSLKLTLSGLYARLRTTAQGNQWGTGMVGATIHGGDVEAWRTAGQMAGYYRPSTEGEWGGNRWNLAYHVRLKMWFKQGGLKLTHTLSPSTFYEVRYNWFRQDQKAGREKSRYKWNPASGRFDGDPDLNVTKVKTINGVDFVRPRGWVESTRGLPDVTGKYTLGGGGLVRDTSWAVSQRVNFDFTSQLTTRHMVKTGLELEFTKISRWYKRINEESHHCNHYYIYDAKPKRYAWYIQDKMEYGGMIANIGIRIEHYDPGAKIFALGKDPVTGEYSYDPFNRFWGRQMSTWESLQRLYPDIFTEWPFDFSPTDYETIYDHEYEVGKWIMDKLPKKDAKTYTVWSPRISISHPISERTKFFFSYGQFYSAPKSEFRYGIGPETGMLGIPGSNTRDIGNPDLRPPKTSAYEVGFEQSVRDLYLIRLRGYSKDESDQVASVTYIASAGSDMYGEPGFSAGIDAGMTRYNTFANQNYEDIRGVEAKFMKVRGRWLTGFLTFDYRIQSAGWTGFSEVLQGGIPTIYAASESQPEPVPSLLANIDFHTPPDLGPFMGNWRFSILQSWSRGAKYIYNPEGLPLKEIEDHHPDWILHYADSYNTNLRITKDFTLFGQRVSLYMDVKNLFNNKRLNTGSITDWTTYIEEVVIPKKTKIGAKDTWKYLNRGWESKDPDTGEMVWHEPVAAVNDFIQFLNPRSFLFGVRIRY